MNIEEFQAQLAALEPKIPEHVNRTFRPLSYPRSYALSMVYAGAAAAVMDIDTDPTANTMHILDEIAFFALASGLDQDEVILALADAFISKAQLEANPYVLTQLRGLYRTAPHFPAYFTECVRRFAQN